MGNRLFLLVLFSAARRTGTTAFGRGQVVNGSKDRRMAEADVGLGIVLVCHELR